MRFRLSEMSAAEKFTRPAQWRVRSPDGEVVAGPFGSEREAHEAARRWSEERAPPSREGSLGYWSPWADGAGGDRSATIFSRPPRGPECTVEGSGEPLAVTVLGAVRDGGHLVIELPDLAALLALANATGSDIIVRDATPGSGGLPEAQIYDGYYD